MKSMIKNSRFVGIDLGTTFTVMAYYDDTGRPKVMPNRDGDLKTPSAVHVGSGCNEILVGAPAYNMMMVDPTHTLKEVKRDVGTDKIYFSEGKQVITPEWGQEQLLRYERESAIAYFGDDRSASEAVITVPAYFQENQRQSVKRSAEKAGISVIQLINEPTAAGLAYGIHEKQGDRLCMILDFGGGTFDASLVAFAAGEANVIASNGDRKLGGKDIDDILIEMVLEAYRMEHSLDIAPESHPAECFAIREEVLRQKHMLSSRNEVKICAHVEGKQVIVPITRELSSEISKAIIDRIEEITLGTVQNAKVNLGEIRHVLLVGGSSRFVPFQEMVKRIFGKNSIVGGQVSPDLAVAEGAAVQAAKIVSEGGKSLVDESLQPIPAPAIRHTDVMPHSLGIGVQDRVSSARYCSVLLARNTPIPCKYTKMYASVDDEQTGFLISVVQGEDGQSIEDCLVVGERELELPARKHSEPTIETTMGYDASGMVNVKVRDLISGKIEDITVDFYAKT